VRTRGGVSSAANPTDDRDVLSRTALQHYIRGVCPEDYLDELLRIAREHADDDLPFYSDALKAAFMDVEPVFTRRRYAEFFWHCATTVPGYAARVVLANGPAEAGGAKKLFELWQGVDYDSSAEDQILQHARDESRHGRMFVRLATMSFSGLLSQTEGARFEQRLPDVRKRPQVKSTTRIPGDHLIDHLVQMNIGEIRTRLHMHLFAPVVFGVTPEPSRATARRMLESLVSDEVRHIGYTAKLMEGWAKAGDADLIRRLYSGRLRTFNRITIGHTEGAVRKYGLGKFPDLLEI
jgi:hypothetical protein